MTHPQYRIIPAPTKPAKAKGVKGVEAQFAHGIEEVINEVAAEGWEYLRSDTLPHEQRQGLTGKSTVFRTVLVFRKSQMTTEAAPMAVAPVAAPAPAPIEPTVVERRPEPLVAERPSRPRPVESTEPPMTAEPVRPVSDDS